MLEVRIIASSVNHRVRLLMSEVEYKALRTILESTSRISNDATTRDYLKDCVLPFLPRSWD